jgi:hypothetical protein
MLRAVTTFFPVTTFGTRSGHGVAAIAACLAAVMGCTHIDDPTGPIERQYYADGPWQVVTKRAVSCNQGNRIAMDLYYPANLGANHFKHPIITWGNGTDGRPSNVDYFLRHLATWGFVVVASDDGLTRDGVSILAAAHCMVDENTKPGSAFFGVLDTNHIGAVGQSQGAGGVLRAMIDSTANPSYPPIITAVPLELPGQQFCFCTPAEVLDTSAVTHGSVFFIDGSADIPVSPPTQPPNLAGEQSIQAFYDAVPTVDANGQPNGVLKLKGTLLAVNHNDVLGQPKCPAHTPFCDVGVFGYLGYPTAWLAYRLGIDPGAKAAFVSGSGEMFLQTGHWSHMASNVH